MERHVVIYGGTMRGYRKRVVRYDLFSKIGSYVVEMVY